MPREELPKALAIWYDYTKWVLESGKECDRQDLRHSKSILEALREMMIAIPITVKRKAAGGSEPRRIYEAIEIPLLV